MSKNTSTTAAPAAKRVSKKTETPAAVAAPAPAAAPVVEKKEKKSKPVVAATTAAPVAAAPVAVPAAAPVTTEAAVETKTVEQEISGLIASHQKIRDESVAAIKTLQKLQKRVAKELKEAGRRKRRSSKKEEEDGAPKEKRPTIFTTPVVLKDELCDFLGKPKGSLMTPAEVTKAVNTYVKKNNLKDASNGHIIHPDAAMRKALGVKDGEQVTYNKNIQQYLYKMYVLPEKKKATTA